MTIINGKLDFAATSGGLLAPNGQILMQSISGIFLGGSSSDGDIRLDQTRSLPPLSPTSGSIWYTQPSGVAVYRAYGRNFFVTQPVAIGPFYRRNFAAGLNFVMTYKSDNTGPTDFIAPFPGSVIALSTAINTPFTAGNGSTAVRKQELGAAGELAVGISNSFTAVEANTTSYSVISAGATDDSSFNAGARLRVRWRTAFSSTPATLDIASTIFVVFYLPDIT